MGWLEVLVEVKTCSVPAAASAARSRFRPMPALPGLVVSLDR
jgi:hypothetical protein